MQKKLIKIIIFFTLVTLYSFFAFVPVAVFNSPDETANYVFLEQYAQHNRLWYEYDYNYGPVQKFIFPRSTYSNGEVILPVGFWGLPWMYGGIAKIFGVNMVEFFTPFLSAIAVFAFYFIVYHLFSLGKGEQKRFSKKIAFVSAFLFSLHPAWWYYSARGLFPNVPFMSMFIIGVMFLFCHPLSQKLASLSQKSGRVTRYIDDFLGSFFICFALLTRPSEFWWIFLGFVIVLFFYYKEFDWYRILVWTLPALFVGFLYYRVNASVYGDASVAYINSTSHEAGKWYQLFFPFGIHPRLIASVFWDYWMVSYWWISFPALLGFFAFMYQIIKKDLPKKLLSFFAVSFGVSFYILLFYGSFDDIARQTHTIGIAYNRYLLPLFLFASIYTAYVYTKMVERFEGQNFAYWFSAACIFLFVTFSFEAVWLNPDGFLETRDNLFHVQTVRDEVTKRIPKLALIASEQEDKFFWPEFQVMKNVSDPDIMESLAYLTKNNFPMYYFTHELSEDAFSELQVRFQEYNLELQKEYGNTPHVLYRVDEKKK